MPLVLGILISYALEPAVAALQRIYLPRIVGSAVLLLALVGGPVHDRAISWRVTHFEAQNARSQTAPTTAGRYQVS